MHVAGGFSTWGMNGARVFESFSGDWPARIAMMVTGMDAILNRVRALQTRCGA